MVKEKKTICRKASRAYYWRTPECPVGSAAGMKGDPILPSPKAATQVGCASGGTHLSSKTTTVPAGQCLVGSAPRMSRLAVFYCAVTVVFAIMVALVPLSPTMETQRAHAQLPTFDVGLNPKEFQFDNIARVLAQQVLQQMTASTVRWINSGFEGSPAFVTDLSGYLLDIADQIAGDFIYGSELGFLCNAFELDVRAVLELQYTQSFADSVACTLSDVIGNVSNFGVNFSATTRQTGGMRGWDDWFNVTTKPQNNQYGALMLANLEASRRREEAERNARQELLQGNGFLSLKTCVEVEGLGQRCSIITPGNVIAEQLNKSLGLGQDSLVNADEIGDIVNALFGQLAQQAIAGVGGLFGLSQASGSSGSYLDRVERGEGSEVGYTYTENSSMQNTRGIEEEMVGVYGDIIGLIDDTENSIPTSCSLQLPSTLQADRAEAEDGFLESIVAFAIIEDLIARYSAAENSSERAAVQSEYEEHVAGGSFHSPADLAEAEIFFQEVSAGVDDFERQIDDAC